MEEENQVKTEPQQVTTKNLKKVEVAKRLAEHNHRKREVKKREEQAQSQKGEVSQYYGIGAVIAVEVIGGFGYYIYQSKKGEANAIPQPHPQKPSPKTNRFEMD